MAKIKDWNIVTSSAEIYVSEKGDNFLIRDNQGDLASFRNSSDNIIISADRNVTVTINDTKKEIVIFRK